VVAAVMVSVTMMNTMLHTMVQTKDVFQIDENFLTVDSQHCLPQGYITGVEYLQFSDGDFSFDVFE